MPWFICSNFEGGEVVEKLLNDFRIGIGEVGGLANVTGKVEEREWGRGAVAGEFPFAFAHSDFGLAANGKHLVGRFGRGPL